MYLNGIALFVAIYGHSALAALPDSCEKGESTCTSCTPRNSEFEPPGVGEVWYSECCTESETSTADPPVTDTKKYCYSYKLVGYPSNQYSGTKPSCGVASLAWSLNGQCSTTTGSDPYTVLTVDSNGCPGAWDSSTTYEIDDTVEDNGVVYKCSGSPQYCSLYGPDLRGVGVSYWIPTASCTGTATPTGSPTFSAANMQTGCPEEFDSSNTYEANDSVSVKRDDGTSILYRCKPFPESQWCNVDTYSPLNTEKLCNGDVCWPQAWIKQGACEGTFTPTATPTFDPAVGGCPEEYDDSAEYEAGDKVSIASGDYGKIYQCKSWPDSGHCGDETYSPANAAKGCNGAVCWPQAWTYVGGCSGTIAPTGTPTFDPAVGGCPEEYDDSAEYEAGDKVSVTLVGEDYGKIYQCKSWPNSGHCSKEAYSPANAAKGCNGEVCWPEAWTYVGGCSGTIAPTGTPTFDPAVGGCPEEYQDGTEYEAGDKVSLTVAGEDYGKIYQCKEWPYNEYCGDERYSPSNTEKGCNGEVCWPTAWNYVGGCTGTIAPTTSPEFQILPRWEKLGCPPEYVANNPNYKEEDYVTVAKNEENTYGVVWQCKNAMTAPWCRNEGYAPGTPYGSQAWEKVGYCDGTISPTVSPTMLASNPDELKRICQFKYKLETTSAGEYIVLQAGSWEKGGTTTFETVVGGEPFDLFQPGSVVRYGSDARKCNGWPYTPYCDQYSPFVRDYPNYNPELSPKGWKDVTCENVFTDEDVTTGGEDEFDASNAGPVFASNGGVLVNALGSCTNFAINPEDYFKSSPAIKGCRKCVSGYGFGTPDDTRSKCFPCQLGYISKVVDGMTQCVVDPSCVECGNTRTPYMVTNGFTCDSQESEWMIANRCQNDAPNFQWWVSNKYCRQTCFEAGRGYEDTNVLCCPRVSCTKCTNEATATMTGDGETCKNPNPNRLENNCKSNTFWTSTGKCQQSCFDAGWGYEGIFCCA